MDRQVLRSPDWAVAVLLALLGVAQPLLAAHPPRSDEAPANLIRELRRATAVQVLLVSAGASYAVTLVDGQAARGRVHQDGCRYVSDDAATVSSLLDILDGTLIGAGTAVYTFGQGGGDLRIGVLLEKDGKPLKALYIGPQLAEWTHGVYDDGWLRLQTDVRGRIETWLSGSQVRYAGGKDDAHRPYWRYANGGTPLPCTTAELRMPQDALRPPPSPPASPEFKAALDAALRNRDITSARFQTACEARSGKADFCQCLLRKLPGPYSWSDNGWPAYEATLLQGRYPGGFNPWYPAMEYTDEERRKIFVASDAATKSCEKDSTPPPLIGPVERIGYPPTPPPPPIGAPKS